MKYPKKKTDVYEIVVTNERGYHLHKINVGRKRKRRLHAYECLDADCHYDFRVTIAPALVEEHGCQVTCPVCESLYVEWLSYGMDPNDVYLDTEEEWAQVPRGTIKCREFSPPPSSTAEPAEPAASAPSTSKATSTSTSKTSSASSAPTSSTSQA